MKIHFGPFTLNRDTRQLLERGREVHLSTRAFELLLVLAANRPRAMSKTELQEHLWPDTFVSENNLPGLVKEIRRALGDDPRRPAFLRTLHGFGYAFAVPGPEPPPRRERGAGDGVTFWIEDDRQIRLLPGENLIGRDPAAAVWFDQPGVSRLHARVTIAGGVATIVDLDSRNGTWVRDAAVVAPTVLADGDVIWLGPARATFRIRSASDSTEVLEPSR